MTSSHPGRIVPQDIVPDDGSGESLTALPISQAEVDELLYGDDRPPGQRIARLQEIAAQLRNEEPGDFGDGDPRALLLEIDEAIIRLQGDMDRDPDLVFDEVSTDGDPLNHRETLSPDSDELEEIEEEDEESIRDDEQPLDDDELDPQDFADDTRLGVDRGIV